jgi:hypothetical protein
MPEIDNSLAASVKPLDVGGALAKAAQLREATINADLGQQKLQHNEREYGENAGLTSGERATMSKTQQEAMGPIGNILSSDQSPQARQQAISLARRAGIPMDDMTAGHLMSAPPEQVKQYGINAQRLGQSSSSNIDQSGVPSGNITREAGRYLPHDVPAGDSAISNRTAVATGAAGQPPVRQITDTIVPNADGSLPSVPKQPAAPLFNDRFKGDMFTPGIVKNPDGTLSSNITPGAQAMRGQAVKQYEKAGEVAQTAQGLSMRLDMMDHSADVLNTAGWSSTGAGANAKLGAAKSVNSLLQTVGLPPAIDPNKVANWEDLNKETTRAGFDLARTLGSREAATIVQSSVSAVPGAESTPMGFKLVSSGIRQAIQREKDYYTFATDYAKTHRGNTFGADVEFNKQFPPDLYSKTAVANAIPPAAINMMKGDPKLASKFDEKYGQGMSGFILHHDQAR